MVPLRFVALIVPDWNALSADLPFRPVSPLEPQQVRLQIILSYLARIVRGSPSLKFIHPGAPPPHGAALIMASAIRRRRAIASDTPSESPTPRDPSPALEGPGEAEDVEKITVVHHHKKIRKRRTTAIFLLGSLFGIVVAGFFANSNDLINLPDIGELSMDSLLDVLPAGLVKDMRDLVVSYSLLPCNRRAGL